MTFNIRPLCRWEKNRCHIAFQLSTEQIVCIPLQARKKVLNKKYVIIHFVSGSGFSFQSSGLRKWNELVGEEKNKQFIRDIQFRSNRILFLSPPARKIRNLYIFIGKFHKFAVWNILRVIELPVSGFHLLKEFPNQKFYKQIAFKNENW